MKFGAKIAYVFPNPWGIHPREAFEESEGELKFVGARSGAGHDACMDPEGRPCGVVMTDQIAGGGIPGALFGARIDADLSVPEKLRRGDDRSPRQKVVYKYLGVSANEQEPHELAVELAAKEPIRLPLTNYYLELASQGLIIAADEESARAIGMSKYFAPPADLFLAFSEMAAEAFNARYEDVPDAYERTIAERVASTEDNEKAKEEVE